jgi:hypothetical protein
MCTNPNDRNYKYYYLKGIRVCKRWEDFWNFYDDMNESYIEACQKYEEKTVSIDRIDDTKGYYKENCRWANCDIQVRNLPTNLKYTEGGETKCIKDWCKSKGIDYHTVMSRINKGMTYEEALNTPVKDTRSPTLLTVHGVTKPLRQWSKELGVSKQTMQSRVERGWPHYDCVYGKINRTPIITRS